MSKKIAVNWVDKGIRLSNLRRSDRLRSFCYFENRPLLTLLGGGDRVKDKKARKKGAWKDKSASGR